MNYPAALTLGSNVAQTTSHPPTFCSREQRLIRHHFASFAILCMFEAKAISKVKYIMAYERTVRSNAFLIVGQPFVLMQDMARGKINLPRGIISLPKKFRKLGRRMRRHFVRSKFNFFSL